MVGSTHWTSFSTIATIFSLTRESISWSTFDIIQVWLFNHSQYVLSKSSSRLPCKWYYPNLNVQSYSCVHLNILCIYFWCSWHLFCSNWKKTSFNVFALLIDSFIYFMFLLHFFIYDKISSRQRFHTFFSTYNKLSLGFSTQQNFSL